MGLTASGFLFWTEPAKPLNNAQTGGTFYIRKGEITLAKIGDILRKKQPKEYYRLNAKKRKKRRKSKKQEHLSFSDIDYIMRHNKGVDGSKCRGRI